MENSKDWIKMLKPEFQKEAEKYDTLEEFEEAMRKKQEDCHFFEGQKNQDLIDLLNKKAIYCDDALVSFHVDITPFEEIGYLKRPVSDGFEVISNKGYYKIRSCRCKLEDGTECSLEDIYTKYYPTYNNGLSEKDLLDAIEKLVKNRRKNGVIYTIEA